MAKRQRIKLVEQTGKLTDLDWLTRSTRKKKLEEKNKSQKEL